MPDTAAGCVDCHNTLSHIKDGGVQTVHSLLSSVYWGGGERAWTMHDGKMEMTEIETGTQYVSVGDRETKSHRQ